MTISIVRLNGFPIRLTAGFTWTLHTGAVAQEVLLPMHPKDVETLLGRSDNSATLVMQGNGKKKVTAEHLRIIGERPSSDPFSRVLAIEDRRHDWKFVKHWKTYNDVVGAASKRPVAPDGTPLAIVQQIEDLTFARYSMNPKDSQKNPSPWTAREILEDVLNNVVGKEGVDWRIDVKKKDFPVPLGVDVQSSTVDITALGTSAVARALALTPGINGFIDLDGVFVIVRQLPGDADNIITSLGDVGDNGRLVVGLDEGGVLRKIDLAFDRAVNVKVGFEMELGVRFDAEESRTFTDDDAWLRNAMQTTDPVTTLASGSTVGPGSWTATESLLPIWDAIARLRPIGTDPRTSGLYNSNPINLANIRRFYLTGLNAIWLQGSFGGIVTDPILQAYLAEIKRSFRLVFQMNPVFAGCARMILSTMPGLIDPETGTSASAAVYSDYAIKPTSVAYHRAKNEGLRDLMANRYGSVAPFVAGGGGRLLDGARLQPDRNPSSTSSRDESKGARRSPFDLNVLNRQGILRLNPRTDPWGNESQVIQSALEEGTIATANWFRAIGDINKSRLIERSRLNIVTGMVPGRVSFERMYHITVTPQQAGKLLRLKIGATKAPQKEETVGYQLQPARINYTDAKQEAIHQALGVLPLPKDKNGKDKPPDLSDPVNLSALKELATAIAASYYEQKLDRWSGSIRIPMRDDVKPFGEIVEVTHTILPGGEMYTGVLCGHDDNELIDPQAMLTASARRVILGTVNPVGA